jgi:hypothetical protein
MTTPDTPIVVLAETGNSWALTLDGEQIAEIPAGNTWRVRRDAFTILADRHNLLVVWEERRVPELGYVGTPFRRDPCDAGCPIGLRGHATIVLLGEPDIACDVALRLHNVLDRAHDQAGMPRLPRIAEMGE